MGIKAIPDRIESAIIIEPGDPSVGLMAMIYTAEVFIDFTTNGEENRALYLDEVRKALTACYEIIACEPVRVYFDFEEYDD